MITYKQLAAALRMNDALVGSGTDIEQVLTRLGVEPAGAGEAAMQRALRMVLMVRGDLPTGHIKGWTMSSTEKERVSLSSEERAELARFAGLWLDGLTAGLAVVGAKNDAAN